MEAESWMIEYNDRFSDDFSIQDGYKFKGYDY